ncbi:hypothetical protein EAF00_008255 [Botryotinia globosa]|nr:hypothetical protein EAF00_008255 [Botryotinia globosa]
MHSPWLILGVSKKSDKRVVHKCPPTKLFKWIEGLPLHWEIVSGHSTAEKLGNMRAASESGADPNALDKAPRPERRRRGRPRVKSVEEKPSPSLRIESSKEAVAKMNGEYCHSTPLLPSKGTSAFGNRRGILAEMPLDNLLRKRIYHLYLLKRAIYPKIALEQRVIYTL